MSLLKIKHLTGNRRNEEAIMFWPFQKVYGVINYRQQEAEGGGAWEVWLQRSLQTWGGSREPRHAASQERPSLSSRHNPMHQKLAMENPELVFLTQHH